MWEEDLNLVRTGYDTLNGKTLKKQNGYKTKKPPKIGRFLLVHKDSNLERLHQKQ